MGLLGGPAFGTILFITLLFLPDLRSLVAYLRGEQTSLISNLDRLAWALGMTIALLATAVAVSFLLKFARRLVGPR